MLSLYSSNGRMNVVYIVSSDFLSSLNFSFLIILILYPALSLYSLCVDASCNRLTGIDPVFVGFNFLDLHISIYSGACCIVFNFL